MDMPNLVTCNRHCLPSFLLLLLLPLAGCCLHRLNQSIPLAPLNAVDGTQYFDDTFCSVLRAHPLPGGYTKCSHYLRHAVAKQNAAMLPLSMQYRLLLVGGYMSDCVKPPTAVFEDAVTYLQQLGISVEIAPVSGLGSSEYNAKQISEYVNSHVNNDPRKYIVLGYSKGASDLLSALTTYPTLRTNVAALVTVAGAVKGSPLIANPQLLNDLFKPLGILGGCEAGDGNGLDSMNPKNSEERLNAYERAVQSIPTYSVVTSSNCKTTSNVLMPAWNLVRSIRKDRFAEDSQVIAREAVMPNSKYLGMALSDHWAIAIPFNSSPNPLVRDLVNHNDYPRGQLFESIYRVITGDLAKNDTSINPSR